MSVAKLLVTVNVSSIVSHTTKRCEYNFKSGWMDGHIVHTEKNNVSVYFPEWDETHVFDSGLVKSQRDINYNRLCQIGDIVHVNNSILPGQTMIGLWWEARIVDKQQEKLLIEWIAPGIDYNRQQVVPINSIRIF